MALYFMYPESEASTVGTWSLTGAATSWEAIDDPAGSPDDATTYAQGSDAASARKSFNLSSMTEAATINSVTVRWRCKTNTAGNQGQEDHAGINIGGVDYAPALAATPTAFTNDSNIWTTNPNTGLPWSKVVLDGMLLFIEMRDPVAAVDSVQFTQAYIEVDYVPNPIKIGAARDVGSRILRMFRRPVGTVELEGPPAWGDVEIGDFVSVSHQGIPDTHTTIPARKKWQRRLYLVLGHLVDSARKRIRIQALDVRDYLTTDWDTMISKDAPSTLGNGIARLNAGAGRVFTRPSRDWVESADVAAAGLTRQVVELSTDVEPFDASGTLLQRASTNEQVRSSFKSGTTGITLVGTGVNGSSITADATDLLFDPNVSPNSLKFLAGTPHITDQTARCTTDTAAILANTIVRVSIDHRDTVAGFLTWRLQRLIDNFYWDNTPATWGAAVADNPLTEAFPTEQRYFSKRINVGAGNTALRLFVAQPAGDTAGAIRYVYHWQIEQNRYATGRILTDGSTVTRAADNLRIENFSAKRVYNETRGTAFMRFKPLWSEADLAAADFRVLLDAYWDANNYDRISYFSAAGPGNGAFYYERARGGVSYIASKVTAVTGLATYNIGWRWCGVDAEENLAAYTISIFVNGVKGTDAAPGGLPTTTSSPYMWIGQTGLNNFWGDGFFSHRFISPFVYSDDEMVDLP